MSFFAPFPFGDQVVRERRKPVVDPYDPEHMVPGSWDGDLDTLPLHGAFVNMSSNSGTTTETRVQALTSKSLFCAPDADVQVGDRVQAQGLIWYVNARPVGDVNPWTGWQPIVEIPLDLTEG